jgi:hypothetical protein
MMNTEELARIIVNLRITMANVNLAARKSCGIGDMNRAAQSMGLFVNGKVETPNGEASLAMLADLIFFGPNERGICAFDRFLSGPAQTLLEAELDMARRFAGSCFSIFRIGETHETTGTWVTDLLDNDRRYWLIDLNVDEPNPSYTVIAVRIFDPGPFHMTLGVITSISDRMANVFQRGHAAGRLPYRRSLAATVYGLAQLNGVPPIHASGKKFVADLAVELRPGEVGGEAGSARGR